MPIRRALVVPPLVITTAIGAACVSACAAPDDAEIVFGVMSDIPPGESFRRLDGEIALGEASPLRFTWRTDAKENGPIAFPLEVRTGRAPEGTPVSARFEARSDVNGAGLPFFTRAARTTVGDIDLLFRARFEWECVPSFQLPGGVLAPDCAPPQTCVAAACEDPFVPPGRLEPYRPDWAVVWADECRPENAGDPEVHIGEGLKSFTDVAPKGPVPMRAGDQGGFHVWLAVRMKNLHRTLGTTELTATAVASGETLCEVKVPWDYVPSGQGQCDLAGIQCVVSYDIQGINLLDGAEVAVSAKIVDVTGDVGIAEQHITLAKPTQ